MSEMRAHRTGDTSNGAGFLTVRLLEKTLHYTGVGTLVNKSKEATIVRDHSQQDRWSLRMRNGSVEAPASVIQKYIDKRWSNMDLCYYTSNAKFDDKGQPLGDHARDYMLEAVYVEPRQKPISIPKLALFAHAYGMSEEMLAGLIDELRHERRVGINIDLSGITMSAKQIAAAMRETPRPPKKDVAQEAHDTVTGPRAAAYGDWKENFTNIADILHTAFGIDLAPTDIIKVLIATKLSRDKHKAKRDNIRDIVGYYIGLTTIDERYHHEAL